MRAHWLAAAVIACNQPPPVEPITAPPSWVDEPPLAAWQRGETRPPVGRSQPPQVVRPGGIVGPQRVALTEPRVWDVPGEPARAALEGREGVRRAIDLIDITGGTQLWRDAVTCQAPIVGVTERAIVCGDERGVAAITLDGKPGWRSELAFVAITGGLVIARDGDKAVVLDANLGSERGRITMPRGLAVTDVVAACGDDQVWLYTTDGKLARLAGGKLVAPAALGDNATAPPRPNTAPPRRPDLVKLAACDGDVVHLTIRDRNGRRTAVAIDSKTGAIKGRVADIVDWWPARDGGGGLEVAVGTVVFRYGADLAPLEGLAVPAGELIASRGELRLVRVSPLAMVVLDRAGVRNYLALAGDSAALSPTAIVVGSARSSDRARRVGLPEPTRRTTRVPLRDGAAVPPAELRDLPPASELDGRAAINQPDSAKHAIAALAVDSNRPHILYAAVLDTPATDQVSANLASIDLTARTWVWQRSAGCGPGTPIGLAVVGDVVICGSRGLGGLVRATTRDGIASWEHELDSLDAITALGDTALARDGSRLAVLDAANGHLRGWIASDDGAPVRAAAAVADDKTWLVSAERGRLVARLPAVDMMAVWSAPVHGQIAAIESAGDRVVVSLDDGDAYTVAAATGEIIALPAVGGRWRVGRELLAHESVGGPLFGEPIPLPKPARPLPPLRPPVRKVVDDRNPDPPELWKPIAPPPIVGRAWHLALYQLDGGFRVRNEYALGAVQPTTARGPAGSPLVVAYAPDGENVHVLAIAPTTGDPLRQVRIAASTAEGGQTFATVVDGTPLAGIVLARPLRAVTF